MVDPDTTTEDYIPDYINKLNSLRDFYYKFLTLNKDEFNNIYNNGNKKYIYNEEYIPIPYLKFENEDRTISKFEEEEIIRYIAYLDYIIYELNSEEEEQRKDRANKEAQEKA